MDFVRIDLSLIAHKYQIYCGNTLFVEIAFWFRFGQQAIRLRVCFSQISKMTYTNTANTLMNKI